MRACAVNREAAALRASTCRGCWRCRSRFRAALGAVAGVLITPTQYTAFNVGVPFAISGFIAAIVGGFGRPLGAFLGGIMLGLAQSIAIVAFGAGSQECRRPVGAADFSLLPPRGHPRGSQIAEDVMDLHKIDWENIPWEPVREGIVRKAFSGAGATVALNKLMPKHTQSAQAHLRADRLHHRRPDSLSCRRPERRARPGRPVANSIECHALGRGHRRRAGAQPRCFHAGAGGIRAGAAGAVTPSRSCF